MKSPLYVIILLVCVLLFLTSCVSGGDTDITHGDITQIVDLSGIMDRLESMEEENRRLREENQRLQGEISNDSSHESSSIPDSDASLTMPPVQEVAQTTALANMSYFNRYTEGLGLGGWTITNRIQINNGNSVNSFIGLNKNRNVNRWASSGTIEFLLNGEYLSFSGMFCLTYERRTTQRTGRITIYGDNVRLTSSENITGGILPQSFFVDVAGVTTLSIVFEFHNNSGNASSIGIGDAILHR